MEGFYAMYYTGISGFGHAVFILNDGIICGADATGGILDGSYSISETGTIKFDVELTVPAGTTLVTGQTASAESLKQKIHATLSDSFSNGQPVPIQTPMGPVNVIFKRLRGLK